MNYEKSLTAGRNAGIWVLVCLFYLFFLYVLVTGFSAYIIRTSQPLQEQTSTTTLDEMLHNILRYYALETTLNEMEKKVDEARRTRDQVGNELTAIRLRITDLNHKTHGAIQEKMAKIFSLALEDPQSQLKNTLLRRIVDDRTMVEDEQFFSFQNTRVEIANMRAWAYKDADTGNAAHSLLMEVQSDLEAFGNEQIKLSNELLVPKTRMNSLYAQLRRSETKFERTTGERDALYDSIDKKHWAVFSSLGGKDGWLLIFVRLPTIAVTLVVTMAAGGLASLVTFTRKFYRQTDDHVGFMRLFSKVGEGIAASIGIFLFAGTGMLMLTQGSGAGPQKVELSPYMVAFIAFISGFMAESAFAKIEDFGKQLFKTENGNGNSQTVESKEA